MGCRGRATSLHWQEHHAKTLGQETRRPTLAHDGKTHRVLMVLGPTLPSLRGNLGLFHDLLTFQLRFGVVGCTQLTQLNYEHSLMILSWEAARSRKGSQRT